MKARVFKASTLMILLTFFAPPGSAQGPSRTTDDVLDGGRTVIVRDESGKSIGRAYSSKDGTETQYRDNNERVTSYSRTNTTTGRVTHYDLNAQRVGYSQIQTGGLNAGKTLHYDSFGNRIGETRRTSGPIAGQYDFHRGRTFVHKAFKSKSPKSFGSERMFRRMGVPSWVSVLMILDSQSNNDLAMEYAHYADPWLEQLEADLADENLLLFNKDFWKVGEYRSPSFKESAYVSSKATVEFLTMKRIAEDEIEILLKFHSNGGDVNSILIYTKGTLTISTQETGAPIFTNRGEREIAYQTAAFRRVINNRYVAPDLEGYKKQRITIIPGEDNVYSARFKFKRGYWFENGLKLEVREVKIGAPRNWQLNIVIKDPCWMHPNHLRETVQRDFAGIQFQTKGATTFGAFHHVMMYTCSYRGRIRSQTQWNNWYGYRRN